MDNKRCPSCGFINFSTAELCRKCETDLNPFVRPNRVEHPKSCGGFPFLKVFLGSFVGLCLLGGMVFLSAVAGGVKHLINPTYKIAWQAFHPPDGGMVVMMPGETKVHQPVQQHGGRKLYTSDVVGQGSVFYSATTLHVTRSAANPGGQLPYEQLPKILDDELKDALTRSKSTLVYKKSLILNSNPALEFEIKPPPGPDLRGTRGLRETVFWRTRVFSSSDNRG